MPSSSRVGSWSGSFARNGVEQARAITAIVLIAPGIKPRTACGIQG